jgi:hypothetical protein
MLTNLFPASMLALLLATSCTVYAPMQPLMPLVSQRGQLEVGANSQFTGRLEATAAYSPLRRVVLTGALTVAPKLGQEYFLVTRQYEIGAGLYQTVGQNWLLSAIGGYGQAYCHRGYVDAGFFGPGTYSEYEAGYTKWFGQVGFAHTESIATQGITYRLVKVDFNYLNSSEYGPLPLPSMLRHELAYFVRANIAQRWKLTFATGFSVSSTPKLDNDLGYPTYGRPEYHANRNLLPAYFMSLGLLFQPERKPR